MCRSQEAKDRDFSMFETLGKYAFRFGDVPRGSKYNKQPPQRTLLSPRLPKSPT